MAGALTQMLAGGSALDSPDEQTAIPALLDASNNQSVVPQAVGMVRDQCGCRLEDAADLLAARAFAEDMPLAEVARQVLSGEIQL
jgi:hypothetical protein